MTRNGNNILGQGSRRRSLAIGLCTASSLLVLWTVVCSLGLIPPRFLPTPWRVIEAAFELRPNILTHAAYTICLVVVGLPLGALTAVYVGIWMRRSFIARSALTPIIESWRPIPPVAIVPFFIIWFGFAWHGKLLLVALGVFFVVVIGVVEAIDRIEPIYLRAALAFGAGPETLVDHVLLPAIAPALLAPLRIALALAISLAVVAEFMGATRGIGHVLNVALNTFATHTILLCAVVLGVFGSVLDGLVRHCHRRLIKWPSSAQQALDQSVLQQQDPI